MKLKINVPNPNNLKTIPYTLLQDFQGDLKTLSEEALQKLKKSIIEKEFFVPKFVWIHKGIYYTLDGHQTKKALIGLELDGYEIPEITILEIEAEDEKDAAEKLLQISSRYGQTNPNTTFLDEMGIDWDYVRQLEMPELKKRLESMQLNFGLGTEEEQGRLDEKQKIKCPECGAEF